MQCNKILYPMFRISINLFMQLCEYAQVFHSVFLYVSIFVRPT